MTGLTLVALAVGIGGNVLSRTAVLDALALWPLAALVVPAALIGLKGGRHRALAPLVLLTWMLVAVGLHLGGFAGLPSGAAALTTDLGDTVEARLTISVDGLSLHVRPGPFAVAPAPVGGSIGVPVVERVSGASATALVVTDNTDTSPWFRFGEYRVTLDPDVTWDLRFRVTGLDLNLSEIPVSGGSLVATAGRVTLGAPPSPATLEVSGDIEISVPSNLAVTVVGSTRVPDDWTVEGLGAMSPVSGDGWTIRVVSGSVRILSR